MKWGLAILAALTVAVGMGSAGAARRPPVVRVAAFDPLAVQGARFRARERVTVTYAGSVRRTRKAVASRLGSFRVTFSDVTEDRCTGFSISAVGATGDRAAVKHKPLPACAPA